MHYYKRHIGDYAKDASHLTLLEHGAYVRLMDVYYSRESPLPLDEQEVFRLLTARDKRETAAIVSVLNEFWSKTAEGWVQSRCDHEIEKARQKAEINRENGKHGGRPAKSQAKPKPRNNPDGYKTETQSVPSAGNLETQTKPYPTTSVSHYPITQSPEREGDSGEGGIGVRSEPAGTDPPRAHATDDGDRWLDVTGCDVQAYESWLAYRLEAGERVLPSTRIEHAKFLAGKGTPERQRTFVAELIRRQFHRLRDPMPDGPGAREGTLRGPAADEQARDQRKAREASELQALVEGRSARGLGDFREPHRDEPAAAYATALRLAEQDRRGKPSGELANAVSSLTNAKRILR